MGLHLWPCGLLRVAVVGRDWPADSADRESDPMTSSARIALSEAERQTLRAVSQMRGFYYKQLGERLGVSGEAVHAYLAGKRRPTSDLLARWFEMLTDTS